EAVFVVDAGQVQRKVSVEGRSRNLDGPAGSADGARVEHGAAVVPCLVAAVVVVVGHDCLAITEAEPEGASRPPRAAGVEAFAEFEIGPVVAVGDGAVAGKAE